MPFISRCRSMAMQDPYMLTATMSARVMFTKIKSNLFDDRVWRSLQAVKSKVHGAKTVTLFIFNWYNCFLSYESKGDCNTPKYVLFELLAYAKVIKVQSFIRRRHKRTRTLNLKVVDILVINMYLLCKNL